MSFTDPFDGPPLVRVRITAHGVIGNAIVRVDAGNAVARLYWNGPGSRPRLMFGDALVTIDDAPACANDRELRRFAAEFGADVARAASRWPTGVASVTR